ncbi:hypothetical protein FACS1894191_7620 [Clostridia bacterium]|nr:hypothetical protein FACS1894191_7620 [Clostridia bacterium]
MPYLTLDDHAIYARSLLEQYKSKQIGEKDKSVLLKAVTENYAHLRSEAEKDYFEVIVNRYLLITPLSLLEPAELYQKPETTISSWEIRKGIVQLSRYLNDTPQDSQRKESAPRHVRYPERDQAREIYIKHKGEIQLTDIAGQLNLSEGTIRAWKSKDQWDAALKETLQNASKKRTERSEKNTERSERTET